MRIGINGRFYAAPVTGVQRFAREMTARLQELADTVLLLPSGVGKGKSAHPAMDLPRAAANLSNGGGPEPAAPAGRTGLRDRLAAHAWEQLALPFRARAAGCDVVLHLGNTAPLFGGPHVMVVYDVTPLTDPDWYTRRFALWYRVALGRAARRARIVVTISDWAAAEIRRVLGVPTDRIRVVPQGLAPFDRPAGAADVARVRQKFGLPERYLLAVGGDRRKNLALLGDMMARWRERSATEPPPLAVVGQVNAAVHGSLALGPETPRLRALGRVSDDDLRALYTGAAVFCFPSHAEGFGRPPLEALACGTPSVVTPYGTATEVLGDAALVVPPDPDAWLEAVQRLLESDGERGCLLDAGRRVLARHSWDRGAERILAACRDAAGPHGATSRTARSASARAETR